MKKLLVFISVFILFSSCVLDLGDYHYYLPDNMKPLLTNNDTIYYLDSVYNRTDTFCLEINNWFRVSDSRYYFEHIDIWFNHVNKMGRTFNYFYTGYGTSGTMKPFYGVGISIDAKYFHSGVNTEQDMSGITKYNVNIRGVIYPTVFVLHEDYMPDSIPNTVYFTYKNGIIRYDYKDGRKYELMNK